MWNDICNEKVLKYLKCEEIDSVALITINREKELNALNSLVLEEMECVLDHLSLSEMRCVVLTGAGKRAFAAGADISEMEKMTKQQAKAFSWAGNRVFRKIEMLPMPVIAAVNGYALGGGFEIALACDIRMASENAVFAFPETGLGIMPGFGGTQRCARLMGVSLAKELIFTGRRMKAAEAAQRGIVSDVTISEELVEHAMELAQKITALSDKGIRQAKAAIMTGTDQPLDQALEQESNLFADCFEEEQQRNRMRRFLNKA